MGEQSAAVAGVLAVEHVGLSQYGERAQGDVGEVADGGGDHVEATRQGPRQEQAHDLGSTLAHAGLRFARFGLLRHARLLIPFCAARA
jgi:hypothetical protein